MAIQHIRQILANMIQVHTFFRGDSWALHLTGSDKQQRRRFVQGIPFTRRQAVNPAGRGSAHLEFHFHGFQYRHHLAHLHRVVFLHQQGYQHAGGRADQGLATRRSGHRLRLR